MWLRIRMPLAAMIFTAGFVSSSSAQSAEDEKRESLSLTVYNNNLGVVRDVRTFDLSQGSSEVKLRGVPTAIDATTVKITSTKHPKDVRVVEQNYEYDLVSQLKLLEKYVDRKISVVDDKGVTTEGTLLSVEGDKLTLQTASGITMLPNLTRYNINVPTLPAGLITRPTLVWKLESRANYTNEPLEVIYQTGGMNWHAEYVAALADDDKSLDMTGWVSLENNSGATYPDAKLKLVAGSLNRVQSRPVYRKGMVESQAYAADGMMVAPPQFEERGLFEYHIYDLQRKTTIANNEIKQISLMEATGVSTVRKYAYRGGRNVAVTLEFENKETNKLGMPLPMGIVRVMKRDKDGSLEFVGEDQIQHTPRDEKITLKVGDAFDILGERRITNQRSLGDRSSQQSIEIVLKNRKDEDVTIEVFESMGNNWEILRSSHEYEKRSAYEVVFKVPVKKRSEQKLTYTVMNSW